MFLLVKEIKNHSHINVVLLKPFRNSETTSDITVLQDTTVLHSSLPVLRQKQISLFSS